MSRKLLLVLLVLVLVAVVGGYLWLRPNAIDATDKVHADLYTGATGVWDPQMQVLPFRPQEIDGQTVGSSDALRLEWVKPEATYNHFLITLTDPITGYTRIESGEHERVSLDPSDLEPDTEYVFAIQACLDRRCEAWLIGEQEYRGRTGPAQDEQKTQVD